MVAIIETNAVNFLKLEFGEGYRSFYTIGSDKKLHQFSLPETNELETITLHGIPNDIKKFVNREIFVLPCQDKIVRVVDMETKKVTSELISHTDVCTSAAWVSENQVISSSKDRTVKIFDININQCVSTKMLSSQVFTVTPTNNSNVFAAGCLDGSIRLIDLRTNTSFINKHEKIHSKQITSIVKSKTNDNLYSVGLDNIIIESDGNKIIRKFTSPDLIITNPYSKLSINPIGQYLAVGGNNGIVFVFDLFNEDDAVKPINLNYHTSPVTCSIFSSNLLITADQNHTIAFWE